MSRCRDVEMSRAVSCVPKSKRWSGPRYAAVGHVLSPLRTIPVAHLMTAPLRIGQPASGQYRYRGRRWRRRRQQHPAHVVIVVLIIIVDHVRSLRFGHLCDERLRSCRRSTVLDGTLCCRLPFLLLLRAQQLEGPNTDRSGVFWFVVQWVGDSAPRGSSYRYGSMATRLGCTRRVRPWLQSCRSGTL